MEAAISLKDTTGSTDLNHDLVEGFDRWLMVQNYSLSTRVNYCHDVRGLASFNGQVSLLELKRDHVAEYLQYLHETRRLCASSRARTLFSLRKFYKFLNMGDVVQRRPMLTIPTCKVPKRLPDALSEDQIEQLLHGTQAPRDLAVLELFYASGLRKAELSALDCQDVYFDADGNGGSVNVAHGKGDKQRSVIIGKFAVKALRAYLEGRSTGPLFLTRRRSQQGSVKFNDTHKKTYWTGCWGDCGSTYQTGNGNATTAGSISAPTKNCRPARRRWLRSFDSSRPSRAPNIPVTTPIDLA